MAKLIFWTLTSIGAVTRLSASAPGGSANDSANDVTSGSTIISAKSRVVNSSAAILPTIEFLSHATIESDFKFKNTRFGGISGIVFDPIEKIYWVASDDRGAKNPPRIYRMKFASPNMDFSKVEPQIEQVFEVRERKNSLPVFDFEGLGILPWGNILLSSESDDNSRPRRSQRLIDVKIINSAAQGSGEAQRVRDYVIPNWYQSQRTGKPTRGLRTNLGFEGLSFSRDQKVLTAASEANLHQDPDSTARILQFHLSDAWQIKPYQEWSYSLDTTSPTGMWLLRGISEVIHFKESKWWVLERGLQLSMTGALTCQIYEVELQQGLDLTNAKSNMSPSGTKMTDLPRLLKTKILDLDDLGKLNGMTNGFHENFEAMTWGPKLSDGRDLLIIASDNNFQSGSRTVFLFLAVGEKQSAAGKSKANNDRGFKVRASE